jgi:hypothetical protein
MPGLLYYFPGVGGDAVAVNQFSHPAKFFKGDDIVQKLIKGHSFIFMFLFCKGPAINKDQQVLTEYLHGTPFYQPPVPFCDGQPQFFPPLPPPE